MKRPSGLPSHHKNKKWRERIKAARGVSIPNNSTLVKSNINLFSWFDSTVLHLNSQITKNLRYVITEGGRRVWRLNGKNKPIIRIDMSLHYLYFFQIVTKIKDPCTSYECWNSILKINRLKQSEKGLFVIIFSEIFIW